MFVFQDLAKWKSRRRSVSQDLIKKEEERKMMERLLSGDGGSQRRKSIKTYREIVEEKYVCHFHLHFSTFFVLVNYSPTLQMTTGHLSKI